MTQTISVVVPVFCNEKSLNTLFEKLIKLEKDLKKKYKFKLEIILIDDGSYDRSWQLLLDFKRNRSLTKIIKFTRNFGGVHAVKIGFQYVTGDAFTMLAADLQDPPELILEMVDKWVGGSKFVICERETRHDPILKICFSFFFYKIIRLLVLKDYPKGGFDLALMDKSFLLFLQNSAKASFPPILAFWLGYKPDIIKYTRQKRLHGKSTWSFKKRINTFFDILFGFSIAPVRLITFIGIVTSILSFSFGFFNVVYTVINGNPVSGYPTIVCLISFLLGLIILMLGILGEYLARIFNEINRRPEAVIEKIY